MTVEYVLEAAARILAEEGLAGFNTNAVARRAGVSVGSLYQYFPGKDAITAALILRSHEAIVAGLRRLVARSDGLSAREAIAAMVDMVIAAAPASPRLHRILEAEEDRLEKSDATLAAERDIDILNRQFFARYVDPTRCDPDQLAVAVSDIVAVVRALLDGPNDEKATLADRIGRTVEGYLAPLLLEAA